MRFFKADKKKQARFASKITTAEAQSNSATVIVTYNSGADNNYLSKADKAKAKLPILRKLAKTNKTLLPIPQLSKAAAEAHTFKDFPTLLLSVVKVNDDGVHKEEGVLITVKGQSVMIDKQDERGRYCIPLVQQQGQWQPRIPTKRAKKAPG